jgi:hypothetical protein
MKRAQDAYTPVQDKSYSRPPVIAIQPRFESTGGDREGDLLCCPCCGNTWMQHVKTTNIGDNGVAIDFLCEGCDNSEEGGRFRLTISPHEGNVYVRWHQ